MKVISLDEANLEDCIRDAQQGRVVLTRKGKPVALLLGVTGLDLEQIELGHSDELWATLRQRRNQKTITRKELEERLVEPKPIIKANGRK